jgi:WD40 repeat protein
MDNKVLILGEGSEAVRILYLYDIKEDKLIHIFTTPTTYMKAKFIDKNTILFGLLSDEISLYSLKDKKSIYTKSVGSYVFSTFAMNNSKTKVVFGDESGAVKLVDIKTGKKLKEFNKFNKDKTISLDFVKDLVINGSSDRRVSLFRTNGEYLTKIEVKFLPYAVAISPNEKYFAVQYNEKNDIAIYDKYGKIINIIKGQTMPLNGMKFIDNNTLLSFSADKVMISKIKE